MITQTLVLDRLNSWIKFSEDICTSLTADEERDGGEVLDGWIGRSQKLVEDSATTARRLATIWKGALEDEHITRGAGQKESCRCHFDEVMCSVRVRFKARK